MSWKHLLTLAIWALTLISGFWQLGTYSNTPGQEAIAVGQWPTDTTLALGKSLPSLLVFVHPRCACSDATVGELERLMPHIKDRAKVSVVFFKPGNESEAWVKKGLWLKAQAIPGVSVSIDEAGAEAAKFGALTSGQTFLYDKNGVLVFRGGITPQRGHMGDSVGRDAILAFIKSERETIESTAVFGCSIKKPERIAAVEEK
jgi:hypothetical protein